MFADLVSFTSLSEIFSVEKVVEIVNLFLDLSSKIISETGGDVSKFIGDGILAYFFIDKADNALDATLSMFHTLMAIREEAHKNSLLKHLYCGCGLTRGLVMEGNIGSNLKMDYTIIGDSVNVTSHLDGLTRELKKALLMSEEFVNSIYKPRKIINLGKYSIKGKQSRIKVYSLDHYLIDDFKIFSNS